MSTAAGTPARFDISQLPSLVKDGMSVHEESLKRRKTCRFIEESCRVLKLGSIPKATAMVFFHRFYAKHAFSDHDRFEVAVASILLAAKAEESPKKLNQIIDECYKVKMRGMQAGRISAGGAAGLSGASPNSSSQTLDPKGEEFLKRKERVLLLERVLLHTIGFELSIDHPYKFLVVQIKKLVIQGRKLEFIPGSSAAKAVENLSSAQIRDKMMNQLLQWAMNFANDSMHTSLCLQFDPQEIATATVFLAAQFAKVRPVQNADWIDLLDHPDVECLVSICMQIVELIAERKGSDEATFAKVRRDLETLKTEKRRSVEGEGAVEPDAKRPRTG